MGSLLLPSILIYLLGTPALSVRAAQSAALPNIVIIFTDDQGYADVGVFGAP